VPGTLTVIGTGISAVGHVTLEARAWIEAADKVLYVVADPVTGSWISDLNSTAEDLSDLYQPGRDRLTTYMLMTERIVAEVRMGLNVCAVFYGHPGVFVFPSHESIIRLRAEGVDARMLPGVSAEDCLFADLGVDPGRSGCQSFEATDFLVYRRRFDITVPLILWQVGVVGQVYNARSSVNSVKLLAEYLCDHYGRDQDSIVYEAAQFAVCDPVIKRTKVRNLADAGLTGISTLYVPPNSVQTPDPCMIRLLGIPDSYLAERKPSAYDPRHPIPIA
jgi:precorrin-3B methylase